MGENLRTPPLSLWRGGLLYQLFSRMPILNRDPLDVLRRSVAFGLVAWAPLMLLSFFQELTQGSLNPVLLQLPLHVRWLVAIPMFFFAERLVDDRMASMATYLRASGIVSEQSEKRLSYYERQTMACCNSVLIEVVLLAIAIATNLSPILNADGAVDTWLNAVTMPLARFLFLRWVERWVFWTVLLVQIATIDLRVNAMHPDRAGGLGALSLPSRALSLVFAAVGSVLASDIVGRLPPGATLDKHVPSIIAWAAICVAVAALPLTAFTPVMIRAKRQMLLTFGVFGQTYVGEFKDRWLPRSADSPLGSSDIQSLADLGNSHEVIANMRLVPFTRPFMIQIAAGALLPVLPVYLHTVSMATLAGQLVKVIF